MKIKEFIKVDELEDDIIQVRGQFVIKTDEETHKKLDKLGYAKKVRKDGSIEVEF